MGVYNSTVEKVILPASDLVLKRTIEKHFRFLEKSKKWSFEELLAYQDEKLRALIYHAYKNVPYYNELFKENGLHPEDIKGRDDLHKIPLLTKEDIRKNYPHKMVAKNFPNNLTILHKSSGSTGQPMQYLVSNDAYSFNIACNLRGWYWMGYRLGDKVVKISQYERPPQKKFQDVFLRTTYLSSSDLSRKGIKKLVDEIRVSNPHIIRCYPDPLNFICSYLESEGINDINPVAITTTGNVLRTDTRDRVESFFNLKIYDSYRCEGGSNFFEDTGHQVYINSMEYGIAEILNKGSEVKPGERGRHITTDLHNYAMPFIRYDSQDILLKSDRPAKNGMAHMTIERVEGRDSDILVTKNGKHLIVIHFVDYFDRFDSVDQFQVQQDEPERIIIHLKTNKNFTSQTAKEIQKYWDDYTGEGTSVELQKVNDITVPPSGKHRFLIRNKEISLGF